MKLLGDDVETIKELIRHELKLGNKADFQFERYLSNEFPIAPDIQIKDKNKIYYVEIKRKASWDVISRLLLYQKLQNESASIVLAAKVIPNSIRLAANKAGVILIQLTHDVEVKKKDYKPRGKLTSEKAWKIVMHLIKVKRCSIRSISQDEDISYAWTHGVVKNLISRGIVIQKGNIIELADVKSLLNAVAWERPIKDLQWEEITTSFESTHDLAQTLTESYSEGIDRVIFAVYTAATLQFGYGVRSDTVYCYATSGKVVRDIKKEYSSVDPKEGIKLIILKPDRIILDHSNKIINGVLVTSREQTLLDVAGLGYSGRDLLNNMVEQYGTNSG